MLYKYNACLATTERFCGTSKDKLWPELGWSLYNNDLGNYLLFKNFSKTIGLYYFYDRDLGNYASF